MDFRLVLFLVCLCYVSCAAERGKGQGLCALRGCNCTVTGSIWAAVNCTFDNEQMVELEPGSIPENAYEMYISGGRLLKFHPKALNSFAGISILRIDGANTVVLEKNSFYNISSSSLLIQVYYCDHLTIKTGAFFYVTSSMSTEISHSSHVSIESKVFSKLSAGHFKEIDKLLLTENSFELKKKGSIGRHGPVTGLVFDRVNIPILAKDVFISSLASVTFQNCRIEEIQAEAFKSSQVSEITMLNTSITNFREGAFNERTLILNFKINKCNISKLESKAIMAAIGNLTVNHSTITDIETGAINATVANVQLIGNEIANFHTSGLVFNSWNRIKIEDNIIKNLHSNFIEAPPNTENLEFTFTGNELYNLDPNALSFVPLHEDKSYLNIDDNFFNTSCSCETEKWFQDITNNTQNVQYLMDTSFCTVSSLLSKCFQLPVGLINVQNFTELACSNETIKCEPYNGESRAINNTSKILQDEDVYIHIWWIFAIIVIIFILISLAVISTLSFVKCSRWLKRKGYLRSMRYNQNETSNDDENTMVTVDENEKLEIPEELTLEFLQTIRERLDNPETTQEASELVERLYEMFIVDDSYDNNNRDEDAHLYEELGNLNMQIPPPPYEEQNPQASNFNLNVTDAKSILELMEEKFNLLDNSNGEKPALMGHYSEPSDAAVHLYSELKKNEQSEENKHSLRSTGSNSMAMRPLPVKPSELPGTSSQFDL